jgi:catechol 2,3-dioxygenase-like lactoylglutathione lyase family enzyme
MDPRVHFITLGVADLDEARRFYVDGLGWKPTMDVPGEVVFIQVGPGLLLALFGADDLDRDSGQTRDVAGNRVATGPFSLAQNVDTPEEVDAILATAEAAGAVILKPGQLADFGAYHGYFADPSGFRWEIAANPGWSIGPDGKVDIHPIGS